MIKFLLYLFESGMCLALMLLVYMFFLKRETYFRFNRFYLLSIVVLSLLIPFLHVNFSVSDTTRYEQPIAGIGKFRTYYETLIAQTDPDYLVGAGRKALHDFEVFNQHYYASGGPESTAGVIEQNQTNGIGAVEKDRFRMSLARWIFLVYLVGIVFFSVRILLLFRWIYSTIRTNTWKWESGIRLVNLKQDLPPFSFLSFVFVNEQNLNIRKNQILEHERAHIKQGHSVDLLLAHFISIFQWFNPAAWMLQRAIKTNHEYMADTKVVKQGFNLLEYQELLLQQFLNIPAIQLVNNFNLISIKQRITMMNKKKSGILAKLKALLIIPAAIFIFIIFANLTLQGPGGTFSNLSIFEKQAQFNELKGLWNNTAEDSYGRKVLIEQAKFSLIESDINLKEYPYTLNSGSFTLHLPDKSTTQLKYELKDGKLKIWWSQSVFSVYEKSKYASSLDDYLGNYRETIDLPVLENYFLIARPELCIDVLLSDDKIFVNKTAIRAHELENKLALEKSKINKLNTALISILLYADKDVSMERMHDLHQVLRKLDLLKVIHMGRVNDPKISKLQTNYVGMPRRLPPMDAKELEISDLEKEGIEFIRLDARDEEVQISEMKSEFKRVVEQSERYVAGLYYDASVNYDRYMDFQDMTRTVIYDFREAYAQRNFNVNYETLSSIQQKNIRKKYPLIIPEIYED